MLTSCVLFACGRSGNGPDREPAVQALPGPGPAPAPLELRLDVPASVSAGQAVPMRIVLANRGDAPVEVELGGEPIAFDLVVTRDGVEVWRRLEGVAVRDILQTLTLAPGEEIEFLDSWPQRNNAGRAVDPGTYRVQGILPVIDPPGGWGTDIHTLTILPR